MTQKKKEIVKSMVNHAFEMLLGSSIYAAMEAAEIRLVEQLKTAIANATTFQVSVSTDNDLNRDVILYLCEKYLKRKNDLQGLIYDGDEDTTDRSLSTGKIKNSTLFFYKGTPIILTKYYSSPSYKKPQNPFVIGESEHPSSNHYSTISILSAKHLLNNGNYGGAVSAANQGNNSGKVCEGLKLITLNTTEHSIHLKEYVKKVFEKNKRKGSQKKKSKWIHFNSDCSETTMKKRDMNTVFMPNNMKEDLMSSIDHFVKKRDWYEKNFVPYHYGILLYGPPGTGKSTLIRSIMTEYYEKYEDASGPVVFKRPCSLLGLGVDTFDVEYKKPKIVVIEDIDATKTTKTRTPKPLLRSDEVDDGDDYNYNYNSFMSLSELLNKIDGLSNLENVIYIFTTNHIENLDKALIRPGRIDKLVKIDIPDRNAYDQFMFYHFGKHIPDDMKVKKGILIPELQNMIVCEKTYEDILDYLRKEEF